MEKTHALSAIASAVWAITDEGMNLILSIAQRDNESPEAVAAKLGRPLMNTRDVENRGGVAVIPVAGPIFRYANVFTQISQATSLDILAQDFQGAVDSPDIHSIVLMIDSHGGMATGIAEFAEMVRAAGKPVTAYIDGDGASAAYWIAAAADEVVVSKTAMVGSVGAVVGVDTRKPDGLVEIVSSQSPNKRPDVTTDEGKKQVQTRIDALAQVFVEDVATYRGVTVNTVLEKFGQGDMRMGEEAVQLGMADRVSTFEALISKLTGATNGSNTTMTTASNHPGSSQPAPIATTPATQPGDFESLAGMTPEAVEKTAANWWEQSRELRAEFGAKSTLIAYAKVAAKNQQSGQKAAKVHQSYKSTKANDPVDFDSLKGMSAEAVNQQAATWWRSHTSLHSQFASEANFAAYCRAHANNRVRIC